jgi:hypothetical protein
MELAEPDYRHIVADDVKTLFPQASLSDLEISAVRMVDHLKGQAWLTCLKLYRAWLPTVLRDFHSG